MTIAEIQQRISKLLAQSESNVSNYLSLHKSLENLPEEVPDYFKKPKLAFLSNFTIQGLPEIVKVRGIFHNLWAETYLAPYNQYAQEILNPESELHKFNPDLIYLFVDLKTGLDPQSLKQVIDSLLSKTTAKIIVFQKEIADLYQDNRLVLFFDFLKWLKESGHEGDWYTKYKDLGDLRLAPNAFPDLAESLLTYAIASSGAAKKCVVVDLDNTLWLGILGEDGFNKISPDRRLQQFLLNLYNRGIILAINSRNNLDEAMEAIEKHPQMILRKKNFAAWQINWGDKASNMLELAKELNLGIDSFVFIDDDLFQQNLIREALPSIAVIPARDNNELLLFLEKYSGFSYLEVTEEDIRRGQMYAEERSRKEFGNSFKTLNDFIKELNLKTDIRSVDEAAITRASQLTQKTNQFNLTTARYSEEGLKEFLKNGGMAWTIKAEDRFGDYGIIGLMMIQPIYSEWRVENFLLSCRILGRGVEKKLVEYLINEARKSKVKKVAAEYKPTSKNGQTENFWESVGFNLLEKNENHKLYHYNVQ